MENRRNQKRYINRKPIIETHISFEKTGEVLLLEDDEVHIITEKNQYHIHQNGCNNPENHAFSGLFYPRKSFRKRFIHKTISQRKYERVKPGDENIEQQHLRSFLFAKKREDENPHKKRDPGYRDDAFSIHD